MRLSLLTFISVLLTGCAARSHPQATAPAPQAVISRSPSVHWLPRGQSYYDPTPAGATVEVEGFTFIGIPRARSEKGLVVDVVNVTKGSFSERQVVFEIDTDEHIPPPLKIGARYSITCAFGIGGNYSWFGYKITDYHEVE